MKLFSRSWWWKLFITTFSPHFFWSLFDQKITSIFDQFFDQILPHFLINFWSIFDVIDFMKKVENFIFFHLFVNIKFLMSQNFSWGWIFSSLSTFWSRWKFHQDHEVVKKWKIAKFFIFSWRWDRKTFSDRPDRFFAKSKKSEKMSKIPLAHISVPGPPSRIRVGVYRTLTSLVRGFDPPSGVAKIRRFSDGGVFWPPLEKCHFCVFSLFSTPKKGGVNIWPFSTFFIKKSKL